MEGGKERVVLVGDMIPPNISEQRLHYMLDVGMM